MAKEKIIKFRVEPELYEVIRKFGEEKGFRNISELMRQLIIMHFMGILLGYFKNKTVSQIESEFFQKYKLLNDTGTPEKCI